MLYGLLLALKTAWQRSLLLCRLPIHLQSLSLRIMQPVHTQHITYAPEMSLSTPLTRMLGMKHPIISAGMYIAGGPELVAAVSNAGEAHQMPSYYYLEPRY